MQDNPTEIEKRFFAKPKTVTPQELDKVVEYYWDKYQKETDLKAKFKLIGQAGNMAYLTTKAGMNDLKRIELYIKILRIHKKTPGLNRNAGKYLSFVITKLAEIQGLGDPVVVKQTKGTVSVETGIIAIGQPSSFALDYRREQFVADMRLGKAVYVGTGGDGDFGIQMQLLDAPSPVLKAEDYKHVISSSETYVISVTEGKIQAYDSDTFVELEVVNGNYKVQVNLVDKAKFFGLVIVICPTNEPAQNDVSEIEGLG